MTIVDVQALRAHAFALAHAFGVRLIERDEHAPDDAFAVPALRLCVVAPIKDETQYAVALHELGHVLAPLGVIDDGELRDRAGRWRIKLDEETAAWDWAQHYALTWTPVMQSVREMTFATYVANAPAPPPPPKPARSTRVNDNSAAFAARIQWGKKR